MRRIRVLICSVDEELPDEMTELAALCAASRRVQSLPQGGWVRKETQGSTTDLAAKANGNSSMSAKRSGPEDV